MTEENQKEFHAKGFTRLPKAIPADVAELMVSRIWDALASRHGMLRNSPATWIAGGVRGIGDINREPEFRPFGSPAILQAIELLLPGKSWRQPSSWGQILATFPAPEWNWDSLFQDQVQVEKIMWHTDYPYDSSPDELAGVQVFCLLADLESGGGGTLVLEGSHLVIRDFVRSSSPDVLRKMKRARLALISRHPWLQSVSQAKSLVRPESWLDQQHAEIEGHSVAVRELTGKACDVYLTHPWLLHAPSPNCNATPRLMCTQRLYRNA